MSVHAICIDSIIIIFIIINYRITVLLVNDVILNTVDCYWGISVMIIKVKYTGIKTVSLRWMNHNYKNVTIVTCAYNQVWNYFRGL